MQARPLRRSLPASFILTILLAFATLLPTLARAQTSGGTGTVRGRVLNRSTSEYLRNASISVANTSISAVAGAGGNYTLNNVPAGEQKVIVSYAGLDTKEQTVNVVPGQVVTLDVNLTSEAYADKNLVKLGEFVVTTEREGNAKAVMEQKQSIEAKRVIASDTFGSISEGNVGEFLKYLPGVIIDYTEADARSVSLGGLDPKYTSVTLDGAPIASSGMGAASGFGANRAFEFEQISISSIEMVEVTKTPQPENPGGALAGVVNLRSKGAFDREGRMIRLNAGVAWNSMSGNPFKKQPGWDDEKHYRLQPNWGIEYSDVFLNRKLGLLAGYNYSYTFAEQKAQTVTYAYDTDPTNNATEVPRVTSFAFRDSPKPTVRYNGNLRVDYMFSPELRVSARAEYNSYHAKFFSRDLSFNFTTTANSPDPDGAGSAVAGPVVPGVEYSLKSQTATVGSVGINQGGGGTNKYGSTANYALGANYERGAFRADFMASFSRSQTWYRDRQFGFFWSINPTALGNLGLRFNREGADDPALFITQTSGPDYRNLANHPNGFSATSNDRRAEDQRYLLRADMRYDTRLRDIPTMLKFGLHINELVNNVDRPMNNRTYTRRGADNTPASADENPALWAEPHYRMNFGYGGNIDGLANLDRWALYKDYAANPGYWTPPTAGQLTQDILSQARDAKEQVDALYFQSTFRFLADRRLSIAPGVRFERTRGTVIGPGDIGDRETRRRLTGSVTGTVDNTSPVYIQTRFGGGRIPSHQDYDTWLRYVHTSYRFTPDLVLKASFNQGISRPDLAWLVNGLTITNDDPIDTGPNRANAGNANLQPEQSDTINLTLEYYTKGIGSMSVSVFRRDFTNFIRELNVELPSGSLWNGEPLPSSVSTEPWIIRTRQNLAKTHQSSIELAFSRQLDFLPGPLKGLTVNTNYTHIRYDNPNNFLRPQNVANLTWNYRYRGFGLAWNTNWTEGYYVDISSPIVTAGGITVTPGTEALRGWTKGNRERLTHTMDFTWEFRRNSLFYLTARNILNQDGGEFRGGPDFRTRWVKTGAIWTSGVRMTF